MKSRIKNIKCPNKNNCLFDPFCYFLGPENKEGIINGELCIRTGTCWELLTGKVYWVKKTTLSNKE